MSRSSTSALPRPPFPLQSFKRLDTQFPAEHGKSVLGHCQDGVQFSASQVLPRSCQATPQAVFKEDWNKRSYCKVFAGMRYELLIFRQSSGDIRQGWRRIPRTCSSEGGRVRDLSITTKPAKQLNAKRAPYTIARREKTKAARRGRIPAKVGSLGSLRVWGPRLETSGTG